jgi:hypothetical protein
LDKNPETLKYIDIQIGGKVIFPKAGRGLKSTTVNFTLVNVGEKIIKTKRKKSVLQHLKCHIFEC